MKNFKKLSKTLLVAAAITGLMATTSLTSSIALAQDFPLASQQRLEASMAARNGRPKIKSMPGTTERAFKTLTKVQEYMQAEPALLNEAMEILKDQNLERLNRS